MQDVSGDRYHGFSMWRGKQVWRGANTCAVCAPQPDLPAGGGRKALCRHGLLAVLCGVLGGGEHWHTCVEIKLLACLVHVEELIEVSVGVEDLALEKGVGLHACHALYPCHKIWRDQRAAKLLAQFGIVDLAFDLVRGYNSLISLIVTLCIRGLCCCLRRLQCSRAGVCSCGAVAAIHHDHRRMSVVYEGSCTHAPTLLSMARRCCLYRAHQ